MIATIATSAPWPKVSPLWQRMIDDVRACKLTRHAERSHIHSCKRFAAFLKHSPEATTASSVWVCVPVALDRARRESTVRRADSRTW
jgi:hypothetical protein